MSGYLMLVVFRYVAATSLLLKVEDLVLCLLDDNVEPNAKVSGYNVHHSKTSHDGVTVLDNLNLICHGT